MASLKSTPKVTGFVGGATEPAFVPDEEVAGSRTKWKRAPFVRSRRCCSRRARRVKVIDGPFQDFNGVVEEVRPEKGKLRC